MPKLLWDEATTKLYETGTDRGVLYKQNKLGNYGEGIAWNGLIGVSQSPEGAEPKKLFANNKKYLTLRSAEEFKGSIKAFTYPEEFNECDGSKTLAPGVYLGQQNRVPFGLVYRTLIGNDTEGTDYGYRLHIIYGASVKPSSREFESVNDDPTAIEFSWDFETTPQDVNIEGVAPTAYLSVDSTQVSKTVLKALEDKLYGNESDEATLPDLETLIGLLTAETPDGE